MRVANIDSSRGMKSSLRSNSKLFSLFLVVLMLLMATPITIIIAQHTDFNESFSSITGNVGQPKTLIESQNSTDTSP
ncbi:MAG: hypothetical protein KKC05_03005, partial [Nanoarchaeota archaeon]|nr:hypothetical protein [Nanoarchaeota archaeon]